MSPGVVPARSLNAYSGYQCRHAGVCCSAGWDIELDAERVTRAEEASATGRLRVPASADETGSFRMPGGTLPDEGAILARTSEGDCVFFDRHDGRRCALHRDLGHDALPVACRQFPRVVLLEGDRIVIAFSHVCPNAAALLLDTGTALAVVDAGAAMGLNHPDDLEGFDARSTPPPFVSPGVAFDPESREIWEQFVLAVCDALDASPQPFLARLADGAERLRQWTPARGPLARFAEHELDAVRCAHGAEATADPAATAGLWQVVAASVPAGLPRAPGLSAARAAAVQSSLRSDAARMRALGRYLAARAFGSWAAYRGAGVRTQVAWLAAAAAALTATATADVLQPSLVRPDLAGWLGAADLWLMHRADDQAVVAALARVETMTADEFQRVVGVRQS